MSGKILEENYLNASLPGSLSGLQSFYRALKSRGIKISRSKVKDWLMAEETYTLHKPARKKFIRNKVIAQGIDDLWQMDLVDMSKFSKFNEGFKFLLTCIDVFSKYAWVIPLQNKQADTVLNGFKEIMLDKRSPIKVQTDKGTEFINRKFKKYLTANNIHLYSVNSELKASVVERFNRTIKEKMFRYFTFKNNYEYVNILKALVEAYNNSYHRTIKMTPNDVTVEKESFIQAEMNNSLEEKVIKIKLTIGDKVRISKFKNMFAKGYTPNWTQEVFTVDQVIPRYPPVYRIKDLNEELIEGVFYEDELKKVIKEDNVYKIDQILKRRKKKGLSKIFVSWKGYPANFNSWIKESAIIK